MKGVLNPMNLPAIPGRKYSTVTNSKEKALIKITSYTPPRCISSAPVHSRHRVKSAKRCRSSMWPQLGANVSYQLNQNLAVTAPTLLCRQFVAIEFNIFTCVYIYKFSKRGCSFTSTCNLIPQAPYLAGGTTRRRKLVQENSRNNLQHLQSPTSSFRPPLRFLLFLQFISLHALPNCVFLNSTPSRRCSSYRRLNHRTSITPFYLRRVA